MYDAFFRQLGVIRAETFADLLDIPGCAGLRPRAAGRRVAVLTSTGGAGTLVADACGLAGFEVPPPDAATVARLAALQEGGQAAADRNPVDVTLAGAAAGRVPHRIDALLDSPGYDTLVTIVGSSALAQPDLVADAMVECQARSDKPVLAYVSPHAPHIVSLLNRRGIPAFARAGSLRDGARRCSAAPRRRRGREWTSPEVALPDLPPGPLNEAESKALFARFGVP